MKVRADIAELLLAGHSDTAIARQLNVDRVCTVAPARAHLGLPKAKSGRKPAATPEDLFWRRVQPVEDGHILWTGHLNNGGAHGGCPVMRHGGKLLTAYRVAFRIRYGREPEGHVTPTCERHLCVSPHHVEDRVIRERTKATFAAIFGASA
ncbi:hypothetical protein [Streptomyces umbrinus]|uniref:hypothetical protein n=1 Tax=Streptomyces umbrinus TaxID=67370 RepID=UPI003C2D3683